MKNFSGSKDINRRKNDLPRVHGESFGNCEAGLRDDQSNHWRRKTQVCNRRQVSRTQRQNPGVKNRIISRIRVGEGNKKELD